MTYRVYNKVKQGMVGVIMRDSLGTRTILWQPCEVLGETRSKYRVRAVEDEMRLASPKVEGDRVILVGDTVLIDKHSVVLEDRSGSKQPEGEDHVQTDSA